MIESILHRLNIIEQTKARLVLRELPLLDWLFAAITFVVVSNLAIFQLWITAVVGVIIATVILFRAQTRDIVFDAASGTMKVYMRSYLGTVEANSFDLDRIDRAFLRHDEDDATQVILVARGSQMGLSVYSRDPQGWKEDIVLAVNAFLHEYRQLQAKSTQERQAILND